MYSSSRRISSPQNPSTTISFASVLEHLSRPVDALTILNRLLRPCGTMTVVEGDHGSTYFHPESSAARMGNPVSSRVAAAGGRQRVDWPAAQSTLWPRRVLEAIQRPPLQHAPQSNSLRGGA